MSKVSTIWNVILDQYGKEVRLESVFLICVHEAELPNSPLPGYTLHF
jgi:hypothetical protein